MMMDVVNIAYKNKTTFSEELREEIKFLLQLKQRTKPLRINRTRSQSKDDSFQSFEYPQTNYEYRPEMSKQGVH